MGRLIDADVLKKDLTRFYDGEVVARKLIDEQPTVDAVEVVRCKNCKFYHRMTAETGICKLDCRNLGNDGFCSEGERKVTHEQDKKS